MKRGWLAAGVCFIALFGATIYLSWKLPLLDALGPGPGFFPIVLAILGLALSVILMVQTLLRPADEGGEPLMPDKDARLRIFGVLLALVVAAAVLEPLGYRLSATIFSTLTLVVLGVRNIAMIAAFAAVAGFGVFHVFYYWLKVPLPIGYFGI